MSPFGHRPLWSPRAGCDRVSDPRSDTLRKPSMATLLLTHPVFVPHDTGLGHPERPDRMRAIDKALAHEVFKDLERAEAPLREDVEEQILLAHPQSYIDWVKGMRPAEGSAPVRLDP